jgi:hypothetical protein
VCGGDGDGGGGGGGGLYSSNLLLNLGQTWGMTFGNIYTELSNSQTSSNSPEVPSSNLSLETGYPDRFLWFPSVSPDKC